MTTDRERLGACLERLGAVFPHQYAQWLAVDPLTWDYRVVAERVPIGGAGYPIAHRTGVIGQVFRTARAIVVPNTRRHPLYDPFDAGVDWELTVPAWQGNRLAAVLNLEGAGAVGLSDVRWRTLAEFVLADAGWSIPSAPPDAADVGLVKTWRLTITAASGAEDTSGIFEVARALAECGRTVLLIGSFPEIARDGYPTSVVAEARGLPLAECVHGVGPQLDVLSLGDSPGDGLRAFDRLGGWVLVDGRYEFAVQIQPREPPSSSLDP